MLENQTQDHAASMGQNLLQSFQEPVVFGVRADPKPHD